MTTDQTIPALLSALKALIRRLPVSCPQAPKNGPIQSNFGMFDVPVGENPYYAVDQAWTRVFQGKSDVAIGGKYGVGVVYTFFVHFSKQEMGSETSLLQLRIEQFIELVKKALGESETSISSSTSAKEPQLVTQEAGGTTGNDPAEKTRATEDNCSSIISQDSTHGFDIGSDESDDIVEISIPMGKKDEAKPKPKIASKARKSLSTKGGNKSPKKQAPLSKEARVVKEKKVKMQKRVTDKRQRARGKTPLSGSSGDERESDSGVERVTNTHKAKISTWAFSHWTPTPANRDGSPVWAWRCNWCETIRTTPRTSGVKEYSSETRARPQVSNFSSHLKSDRCKIPARHAYGATSQSQSLSSSAPAPTQMIKLSPESDLNRQQQIMHDFTERAKESPGPKFSREGFRVNLVKAIIRDGLPFAFTEGAGIKQLFKYSIPSITLPSRHTICRDLDLLYGVLREELKGKIAALTSKCATSSDVWSSRNSVFAFLGTKIFWISGDWVLESHVLDLIHLEEGHSGAITGKLMFDSLVENGVATKMTNVADNTSSNQIHNRAISKRRRKAFKTEPPQPDVSDVGCAGHVVHLVAQELLSLFGIVAPTADIDCYVEYNRRHGLVYTAETDSQILAEEEQEAIRFEDEEKKAKVSRSNTGSRSPSLEDVEESDSEWEEPSGDGDMAVGRDTTPKAPNIVEKIHEVITHINRSPIQRSIFRRLVIKYCRRECHKLMLVKGMDVRWNSKYAELKRAKQLRAALDQYINQLEEGKAGKKLKTAKEKRLRWYITPWEWEAVDQICVILETFHSATIELSRGDIPTLPMVLPVYKLIESNLEKGKGAAARGGPDMLICEGAFDAALAKLAKYTSIACSSELHLLAVVLHPSYRIGWFEDRALWESASIATRVRTIIVSKYSEYAERYGASNLEAEVSTIDPKHAGRSSGLLAQTMSSKGSHKANIEELDSYLRDTFPCDRYDDVLHWWKKHESAFPILARLARDILAIPGVSISVERLFSVCRHVITEARCSMTANTARMTVCAKEWLTEGLGDDLVSLANSG